MRGGANNIKRLLLVLLLFISFFSYAQEYDSIRSLYVKEFPAHFNAKVLATDRLLILNLRDKDKGNSRVNYSPNDRGYIGLGAYIFDLGLEVAVKVPAAFERSRTKYGETDFIDFQGNIYGKKWCVDGTFQHYEGFYVSNAEEIFPDFSSDDVFPQRTDLSVTNVSLNGIHIFNHQKFSFRSGFNQADRQIKSAGSPILLLSATRFSVNADSIIVPHALLSNFGKASGFTDGIFLTFSALPGYAYNFVLKNFFINLNAAGGAGVQYQKFELDAAEKKQWNIEPKLNLRAALGYDNDNFFAGASFILQGTSINIEGMRINNTTGNYKFFVGYRFEEFGVLKKYSIRDIIQ